MQALTHMLVDNSTMQTEYGMQQRKPVRRARMRWNRPQRREVAAAGLQGVQKLRHSGSCSKVLAAASWRARQGRSSKLSSDVPYSPNLLDNCCRGVLAVHAVATESSIQLQRAAAICGACYSATLGPDFDCGAGIAEEDHRVGLARILFVDPHAYLRIEVPAQGSSQRAAVACEQPPSCMQRNVTAQLACQCCGCLHVGAEDWQEPHQRLPM